MESKDMSKAKAVSTNKVKKSREDWIFDIILYTIGVLLIIITLYPMYFIIIASFSDPAAVSNGQIMFLPKGVNFKGYKQLASYENITAIQIYPSEFEKTPKKSIKRYLYDN